MRVFQMETPIIYTLNNSILRANIRLFHKFCSLPILNSPKHAIRAMYFDLINFPE